MIRKALHFYRLDYAMAEVLLGLLGFALYVVGGPLMVWPIVLWLVPIMIAIGLGRSRDRTGWAWGLLLGWLGVLILAIMRPVPRPTAAE